LKYIFLCLPPTNDYQEVSNFDPHGGQIFKSPGSKEKYVRYTITDPEKGEEKLSYDYIPKVTEYSTAAIKRLYPYDSKSDLYKIYTAKYYDIFDTDNEVFKKASAKLWKQSSDVYDYAGKCFDYVEKNFAFKNNPGIWHSTSEIIHYGGGDCGNLAAAFITLLRCRKVPARHVITRGHAWSEFYLVPFPLNKFQFC
jgi:transglutaminase-like putative cysteine protease